MPPRHRAIKYGGDYISDKKKLLETLPSFQFEDDDSKLTLGSIDVNSLIIKGDNAQEHPDIQSIIDDLQSDTPTPSKRQLISFADLLHRGIYNDWNSRKWVNEINLLNSSNEQHNKDGRFIVDSKLYSDKELNDDDLQKELTRHAILRVVGKTIAEKKAREHNQGWVLFFIVKKQGQKVRLLLLRQYQNSLGQGFSETVLWFTAPQYSVPHNYRTRPLPELPSQPPSPRPPTAPKTAWGEQTSQPPPTLPFTPAPPPNPASALSSASPAHSRRFKRVVPTVTPVTSFGGTHHNKPKPTSERFMYKNRMRVVYLGVRGGKYIIVDGKFVSLASINPKNN